MASKDYRDTLPIDLCTGCTDPYSIPLNAPIPCDTTNTSPKTIPETKKEVCEAAELQICAKCGSQNISDDGFCLDCASNRTIFKDLANPIEGHRLIAHFRSMGIFQAYSDPMCYSDLELNYFFVMAEKCLKPCDYSCAYDYALLLYVAHKLELAVIQEAETTGRFAQVTQGNQPKRPSPMYNQGASGDLFNSEFQLTVWGLQLLQYKYTSPHVTMFAI